MEISNNQNIKNAGISAGIGAVALGAKEIINQKRILSRPDEFIRNAEARVAQEKTFKTPFFMGTQEASEAAIKQLDEGLEKFKSFAKGGKLDFKTIGKKTAIGAGIGAAAVGLYLLARKLSVKCGVENKKIERDIVMDEEANKAIKDIEKATGAVTVQNV